jgi:hypothetical protein
MCLGCGESGDLHPSGRKRDGNLLASCWWDASEKSLLVLVQVICQWWPATETEMIGGGTSRIRGPAGSGHGTLSS